MARESEMIRNGGGLIDVTLHSQVIFCYNGKISVPGGGGGGGGWSAVFGPD